jgi:hypothetical protein
MRLAVAGKHYNHAKLFEGMRTALAAWSERVRGIVGGAEPVSNVRPLRIAGSQASKVNREAIHWSVGVRKASDHFGFFMNGKLSLCATTRRWHDPVLRTGPCVAS